MLLFPKKPKFFKNFSNRKIVNNSKNKKNILKYSKISLIVKEATFIPNFQIETIRLFLRRYLKKRAQIFFRIFPNQPITKKPNEVRLGRGKGNFKYWAYYIKQNTVFIEISGSNLKIITFIISIIKYKLAVKTYVFNKKFRWIL